MKLMKFQFNIITTGEVFPCFQQGICGGFGSCSLPGPRSGHTAVPFFFNGGPSVILLFGGEVYSSSQETTRELSHDLYTGYLDGSSLSWARLNVDCSVVRLFVPPLVGPFLTVCISNEIKPMCATYVHVHVHAGSNVPRAKA